MIVDWDECFGANYYHTYSECIDVLPNGNIINSMPVTSYNIAFSDYHGGVDSWVFILDENGQLLLERCFGGSGVDHLLDIEVFDDYIYLLGHTTSTDGDVQSEPVGGAYDLWVVKTDFDLNIIWERRYGCLGTQQYQTAKLTEDGGLVLLMDFFNAGGGDVSEYYGGTDIWVCEIDANGDILWEKTLGNAYENYAVDVLITELGEIIVIGEATVCADMVDCGCHSNTGTRDIWVVALEQTGEILWQKCYGGSDHDVVNDIIIEEDGFAILGGTSSIDGDVSNNYGSGDLWMLQIDDTGELLWENNYGGTESEGSHEIFKTEDNGYFIFGVTGSRDGDVNHVNCPDDQALCAYNIWVLELNANKEIIWNRTYGAQNGHTYTSALSNTIKRVGERDFMIAGIIEDQANHSGDVDCEPYPINSGKSAWIFRLYDPIDGISNLSSLSLKTYPNPATKQIFLELPEHNGKAKVEILDIFGNIITQLKAYDKQTQVLWDCSHVASGIYFYQAEIEGKIYKGKFVVE